MALLYGDLKTSLNDTNLSGFIDVTVEKLGFTHRDKSAIIKNTMFNRLEYIIDYDTFISTNFRLPKHQAVKIEICFRDVIGQRES